MRLWSGTVRVVWFLSLSLSLSLLCILGTRRFLCGIVSSCLETRCLSRGHSPCSARAHSHCCCSATAVDSSHSTMSKTSEPTRYPRQTVKRFHFFDGSPQDTNEWTGLETATGTGTGAATGTSSRRCLRRRAISLSEN
ncbi:hypothetical protein JMJ77_0002040 [Colletotrichum scovillei]|uniref:Uncharacterized protein n=1 Tax=Colletotrichum scovillei TaxID=1209932 RepID=A0A9P7R9Z0_9PEZI|nr:hypothetical protein JMJ77_0002040 [Colletotrichum scovillei]KAG7070453.1 hypothetical protein JMJ76_0001706 [Colletotrichum scovillei]KAG7078727.1 hypothetical protein JMJ78_0002395 [Colletotrichum scovillei]